MTTSPWPERTTWTKFLTTPSEEEQLISDNAIDLLAEIFNPTLPPGPPYTHILRGDPMMHPEFCGECGVEMEHDIDYDGRGVSTCPSCMADD